jgi:hypothetical protein
MSLFKQYRFVFALFVVFALLGAVWVFGKKPGPRHLDLPEGTIYYKGPMRARGSKTVEGVDTLNPEILGDEGSPTSWVPSADTKDAEKSKGNASDKLVG